MTARSRAMRGALAAGLALAAIATAAAAGQPPAPEPPARRFARELRDLRAESVAGIERQRDLARVQLAIVGVALAWWLHGLWLARRADARGARARRVVWGLLAALAVASFYRFSLTDRVRYGMHIKDAYHYFIGGKYFPELGYGRIYRCTLAVAVEQRRWWVPEIDAVRDLATMIPQPAAEALAAAREDCRPRFSARRWEAFGGDLGWFFDRVEGPVWRRTLNDFGFNPSPVWTLLAWPLTRFGADALPLLVQVDTLLVLAALAAVGWAFGFEALGLAAIVWGTGFLWRYTWVGDAFLRQVWFASALAGVACLARGRAFAGGALLATSAGVRLFPAIFPLGYAAHALRGFAASRRFERDALRAAAGVALAGGALLAAGLLVSGQGGRALADFAHNTAALREVPARNLAGLPALLWRVDGTTALQWHDPDAAVWFSHPVSLAIRIVVGLASAALFWRALRRCEAWEAAALAFALIPLWVAPTGYYFHFVVLAAPLALRRPWIGVWLLAACAGWLANGIAWRPLGEQFTAASAIAVSLSFAVLAAAQRPARGPQSVWRNSAIASIR